MKKLLLTLGLLLCASVAFAGQYPDISLKALKKAMAENKVTLIDVNGKESYKSGHIPGALDYFAVKNKLASKLPADKNALVVAYCGSEYCGAYAQAAQAATKLGYTNVKHFKPGLAGWEAAKLPLQSAK